MNKSLILQQVQALLSGEKTCEKFGKYFSYVVREAEQSIKEYVALSLSIPPSKESRFAVVRLDA